MRTPRLLNSLATAFASIWAGLIAFAYEVLKNGRAAQVDWRFVLLIAAFAFGATAVASRWVPVERQRDQVFGLTTALLSSGVFSCLVAIGVFPLLGFGMPAWPIDPKEIVLALMVGFFAFWFALFISVFCSVIGATVFHLGVEAACWWSGSCARHRGTGVVS